MKKLISFLTITSLIVIVQITNAQGQWLLNGNPSTGNAYIGTNFHSDPFPIHVAIGEAMRIDTFGNVGIGTPTPANLFNIDGNTAGTGEVFRTDAPVGLTRWRMFSGNVSTNEKFRIQNDSALNHVSIGTVQAGHLNFFTANINTPRMIILGTTASVTHPVFGTFTAQPGNVGISATPGFKLDVRDNSNTVTFGTSPTTIAGHFLSENSNAKAQIGLWGQSDNNIRGSNIGVFGVAIETAGSGNDTMSNTGIQGQALGSYKNIGVSGSATTMPGQSGVYNVGVAGVASGKDSTSINKENVGVRGTAYRSFVTNVGVQGIVNDTVDDIDTLTNVGLNGIASGARKNNYGLLAFAKYDPGVPCRLVNAAVHGNSSGSPHQNRGGSFVTDGPAKDSIVGFSYSVWGRSTAGSPSSTNTPPWGTYPNYGAGHFLGDVFVLGSIVNNPTEFLWLDTTPLPIPGGDALDSLSNIIVKAYKVDSTKVLPGFPLGWHYGFDTTNLKQYLPVATRVVYHPPSIGNLCQSESLPDEPTTSIVPSEILPLVVAGLNELSANYVWKQSSGNVILTDTTRIVVIGASTPTSGAKLEVLNDTVQTGAFISTTTDSSLINIGIEGRSQNALLNIGVRGTIQGSTSDVINIAVSGRTPGSAFSSCAGHFQNDGTSRNDYGIYASANSANGLSGYFQTNIKANGVLFTSDLNLKDSIQDISNALATLSLLKPKTFIFKRDSFPYMNLPEGVRYGLISQAVDTIPGLENLVQEVLQPEILDTDGSVLMDTMTFLGLNYTELIGLLVAGINELSDTMVTTCEPTTLTHRVPVWSSTNKMLCNSRIIDDGDRVGVNSVQAGGAFTVTTTTDTAAIQGEGVQMGGRFKGSKAGVVGFSNGNTGDFNFGVLGSSENSPGVNGGVGGLVETHTDTAINAALFGIAGNSGIGNVGVAGISESEGDTSLNIGIIGIGANSDGKNYGGRFETHNSTGVNYGIYARVEDTDSGSYAGFFEGDIYTSGVYLPSDGKLKENITDVDNALSILSRLQTKNYEYKTSEYPSMNLPQGRQYGLIAEEAERVVPELVQDIISPEHRDTIHGLPLGKVLSDEIHFKGINYMGLIPLLISGIQQQQAVIDSLSTALNTRFSEIEARLNNCCREQPQFRITGEGEGDDESINRMTIELNSMQYIVLDQNVPNPFAEQTSISYFIPDEQTTDNGQPATVSKAQIVFFDISGRIIKTADLEKGNGIITVFAPNLSSGTYSYSLLIDGKAVQTKKMVKMK